MPLTIIFGDAIKIFSDCGEFLATGDTDRCVSVYKQNTLLAAWELLGRCRGHSRCRDTYLHYLHFISTICTFIKNISFRPLTQLMFGRHPDTGARTLLSLGKGCGA